MNYTQILKKAWRTMVSYRGLWIFGVLLALTSFSAGWAYMVDPTDERDLRWEGITIVRQDDETFGEAFKRTMDAEFAEFDRDLERFLDTEFGIKLKGTVGTYLAIAAGTILFLYITGKVVRYVSETALIRMVDRHEESGEKLTVRRGFRLGWSRAAWRLLLIDLVIDLVAVAVGIALFALILGPIPLWVDSGETAVFVGAFLTGSLALMAIAALIVLAGFVSMLKVMARRACALEGLTVGASIWRGYTLMRSNLKEMVMMGIVNLGINGIWPAVIGLGVLLLLSAGLMVGAVPAAALANLANPVTLPAAIIGGSLVILLFVAPLAILEGLLQVFVSSMWTLAFRQVRDQETEAQERAPSASVPDQPLPAAL